MKVHHQQRLPQMFNATLNYYPNNEYRLCIYRTPAPRKCGRSLDIRPELETPPKEQRKQGVSADVLETPPSLKPGWGAPPRTSAFGLNGKRSLLRAGGALDKAIADPSELIFLTGTLPGSTPEAYQALANWSAYAVHSLKAWLAKYVPAKYDFYVWELQKRGALHLHYCIHVSDNTIAKFVLANFQTQWNRILESICEKSGVDVYARLNGGSWRDCKGVVQAYAQRVRKSVAAYLSKYCGKSAGRGVVQRYYPTRWWGVSRPLNALLGDMTKTLKLEYLRPRQAGGIAEEVGDVLAVYCSALHRFCDRTGRATVWVGYSTHELFTLCTKKMAGYITGKELSRTILLPGLNLKESIISRLLQSARSLRLSPYDMSRNYSVSAANSLSVLLQTGNCNFWQALEIAQAIECLCANSTARMHYRSDTQQSLQSIALISSFLRLQLRQKGHQGLQKLLPSEDCPTTCSDLSEFDKMARFQ